MERKYNVGDKVRIVSKRAVDMNQNGGMDYWLGQTMTIAAFEGNSLYIMEEDNGMWCWRDDMIAGPAEDRPESKIDLHGIRFALFDFDDTLYVHNEHRDTEGFKTKTLYANITGNINCLYNESGYNGHMYKFLAKCKNADIPMGLISAANAYSSIPKLWWIESAYGVTMHNLCTASSEDKVNVALNLAKALGDIDPSKILLVDDYWKVVRDGANAGIRAVTPMEIVNFISRCDD